MTESTPAAGIPDLDALLHARYGAAAPRLTEPGLRDSATLAALACFSIAGSRAGQQASGPGSFQVALLDALYALTPDDLSSLSQLETLHAV